MVTIYISTLKRQIHQKTRSSVTATLTTLIHNILNHPVYSGAEVKYFRLALHAESQETSGSHLECICWFPTCRCSYQHSHLCLEILILNLGHDTEHSNTRFCEEKQKKNCLLCGFTDQEFQSRIAKQIR